MIEHVWEITFDDGSILQVYNHGELRLYEESRCGEGQLRSASVKGPDVLPKFMELYEDMIDEAEALENPQDAEDDEGELDDDHKAT